MSHALRTCGDQTLLVRFLQSRSNYAGALGRALEVSASETAKRRSRNRLSSSGPLAATRSPGVAPLFAQARRKTSGIQPRRSCSISSPKANRARVNRRGRWTPETSFTDGSRQRSGEEVTRYSRHARGRMGWMLQLSSSRKGQGTPA